MLALSHAYMTTLSSGPAWYQLLDQHLEQQATGQKPHGSVHLARLHTYASMRVCFYWGHSLHLLECFRHPGHSAWLEAVGLAIAPECMWCPITNVCDAVHIVYDAEA